MSTRHTNLPGSHVNGLPGELSPVNWSVLAQVGIV
jgi:hypothetical protein